MPGLTPYQTVGPFFDFGLTAPGCEVIADQTVDGPSITIEGTVFDGVRQPVPDALIEIWQADASGRYPRVCGAEDLPAEAGSQARQAGAFRGFGRCGTDPGGRFAFTTIVPGRVPGPDGLQAPHLVVGVLARGILTRLLTRLYFDDQPSNHEDAILRLVPADRRATLVARLIAADRYRFDIVLQGAGETVFFDV